MNKYLTLLSLSLLCVMKIGVCQLVKQPDGGGNYQDLIQIEDGMSPEERSAIISMLEENEALLRSEGKLQLPPNPDATLFAWPVKQALGFNDNGFYGISNYVDENPAFPNLILDYNCLNRTYDQSNGYNHQGTDIFTWPFYWQKMARNAVEIIAAAPGIIIGKSDGNYDQNCAFCSVACTWNAVYVMQDDGSVAWYGHMKSGSLTPKNVGDNVALGEYLGVVGSSGNSTGPHLHFEVYTNSSYTQLVDPWAGSCNSLGGTSWWANQQPYYVPTINKIMTHSAPPNMTACPTGDAPNEKINFASGQTLYVGSYYRDQQIGQQVFHTIYMPNDTVWHTWIQNNFTTWYAASWWWYSWTLPNSAATGNWRYEVVYNGKKLTTWFAVNSTAVTICPNNINPIFSNLTGNTYQWQADTGGGFIDISDNSSYAGTTTNELQLNNVPSSFYGYQYRCLVNGSSYSNVISLKFVSYWDGSKGTSWEDPFNWSCGNVPDANTDVVLENGASNYPEVNSNTSCRTVTVNTGALLTIKPGVILTVTH
jgi:hypothetical protein